MVKFFYKIFLASTIKWLKSHDLKLAIMISVAKVWRDDPVLEEEKVVPWHVAVIFDLCVPEKPSNPVRTVFESIDLSQEVIS